MHKEVSRTTTMDRRQPINEVENSNRNTGASRVREMLRALTERAGETTTKTAATLVIGSLALAGCAPNDAEAQPPQHTQTQTQEAEPTAPSTPEATPTPDNVNVDVDPTQVPTNNIELGTFALLSPEAQARMRELGNMDTPTFRTEPYEDQLAFLGQVFDNQRPIADWLLEQNNIELTYTDNPTTAQQALDNLAYINIMANHLVYKDSDGSFVFDTALAQKFASFSQDTRVADSGMWDEITGSFTARTMYSYESDYNSNKCIADNDVPLPAEGPISISCSTPAGGSLVIDMARTNYVDMSGNPASVILLTNLTQL